MDSSDLAKHTFSTAGKKTLDRITKSVMPQAVKVLNKYLNVIRVNGNLKITRMWRMNPLINKPKYGLKLANFELECAR